MTILGALILISAAGIGAVFWLLKNEKEGEEASSSLSEPEIQDSMDQSKADEKPGLKLSFLHPKKLYTHLVRQMVRLRSAHPEQGHQRWSRRRVAGMLSPKAIFSGKRKSSKEKSPGQGDVSVRPKAPSNLLKGVLEKFKFGKNEPQSDDVPDVTPLPSLKEYLDAEKEENIEKTQEEAANKAEAPSGTASIKTVTPEESTETGALSKEEEKRIEKEIELAAEVNELKEKYNKLDALFSEKSSESEKAKQSLNHELENRKEFNKVKDVLEKELKDSKDKARNIQVELNDAKTEITSLKGRNAQLDEKATKLEKELLEKEDKINELVKRLQTFASPMTADTPPAVEKEGEKENNGEAPSTEETGQTEMPAEDESGKLQPDILSGESQKEHLQQPSSENGHGTPDELPGKAPEDEERNQRENEKQ